MTTDAAVPRIAPLQAPFEPEAAAQLERWMPPGSGIEPLALFRTLVRHERLAARMRPLGAGILGSGASVPIELREVMIDRTCALAGAEYEWGVHVAFFADRVGLTPDQVTSLTHGGPDDPCWDDEGEQAIIRAVDDLHDRSTVADATWALLERHLSEEQQLDLLMLCGWYHAISFVANGAGMVGEPGAPTFADVAPGA